MQKQLSVLGFCSLLLGAAAALLCLIPFGMFYSIPVGFLGMVCSTIYVYLDTKYSINARRFTAGIAGMILSSIPILLVLFFIIMGSVKR